MLLPEFDLGEAVNQAISATTTLVGVLGGGLLAFRLGIRQLRRERAVDRRLEWHEKLLAAIDEYKSVLGVLVAQYENPPTDGTQDLRNYALTEATKRGREVQSHLLLAELYGTVGERAYSNRVFKTQLDLYIATWSYSANPEKEGQRLPEIKGLIAALEEAKAELVSRIRDELALHRE